MKFLKIYFLFINSILLISCAGEQSDITKVQGPMTLSLDPNIVVEDWTYLSPEQLSQDDNPFVLEGITFGNETHRALIIWTEQGFDLYWGELPCATRPIVTIQENSVIELFGGKQTPPPPECLAMETFHAMRVTLSSDTALLTPDQWAYELRPSEN